MKTFFLIAAALASSCTQPFAPPKVLSGHCQETAAPVDPGAALASSPFDEPGHFWPIRFDGDADQDFLSRDPGGGFRLWKSDGARLQPAMLRAGGARVRRWATGWSDYLGWGEPNRIFVSDVNHDGKDDLVFRSASGVLETWYSNGLGFVASGCKTPAFPDSEGWSDPNRFIQMDFSGDGFKDLVARSASGDLQLWESKQMEGGCWGFALVAVVEAGLSDACGYGAPNRFVALKWDGDADDDLLVRYGSGEIGIFSSTGLDFDWVGAAINNKMLPDSEGWATGSRVFVADVDGDGRQDMLWREPDGVLDVYSRLKSGGQGYALTEHLQSPFSDSHDAGVGESESRLFLVAIDTGPDGGTPPMTFVTRLGGGDLQVYKRANSALVQE